MRRDLRSQDIAERFGVSVDVVQQNVRMACRPHLRVDPNTIHPRTVERMARAGVFHGSRKLGKTWLILWRSVQRYTRSAPISGF